MLHFYFSMDSISSSLTDFIESIADFNKIGYCSSHSESANLVILSLREKKIESIYWTSNLFKLTGLSSVHEAADKNKTNSKAKNTVISILDIDDLFSQFKTLS